ncbi:hypothetical protein Q4I32_000941 [Leishmania shawi]|uniref:Uncharacterized protein n=1 Tax=Leishmania shawi TaxID=5680 RepID=A0AAW3C7Z9_9TRYP
MAKSSRSKWKKMHRRQRAQAEAMNTVKRIRQLSKKLELTVKGGISAVPPQEPEKRFHFLNPELDSRVPNTRKHLNNNYRAELNHVQYDYTKPLKLAPPKTNMYGKTDVNAPHRMTVTYETIDADAPLAGHALTKADMERLARRQKQQESETSAEAACAEEDISKAEVNSDSCDSDDNGPEEYVIGMNDVAPHRASGKRKANAKKGKDFVAPKATMSTASASAGASSSVSVAGPSSRMLAIAAAAAMANEEGSDDRPRNGGVTAVNKISSMQTMRRKNGTVVSTGGASKMKKVGHLSGSSGTRVVSSGTKAAKKTGNAKHSTKSSS